MRLGWHGKENLTETNKFLNVVKKKKTTKSWVLSRSDCACGNIAIIYNRKMKKCWYVEFSEVELEASLKQLKFEALLKFVALSSDDSLRAKKEHGLGKKKNSQ